MSLATGYVLQNRYRIVKLVGQGGFGAVYRAWDLTLRQPVAVKENFGLTVAAQHQFEREAIILEIASGPRVRLEGNEEVPVGRSSTGEPIADKVVGSDGSTTSTETPVVTAAALPIRFSQVTGSRSSAHTPVSPTAQPSKLQAELTAS